MEINKLKKYLALKLQLLELKTEYKVIRLIGILLWSLGLFFTFFFFIIALSLFLAYLIYSYTQNFFLAFLVPLLFYLLITLFLLFTRRFWIQFLANLVYRQWLISKSSSNDNQEANFE